MEGPFLLWPEGSSVDLNAQVGLAERLKDLGTLGALFLVTIGGFRGWYVWRWQYDELEKQLSRTLAERDEWAAIVKESLDVADHALRKRAG